jgi:plasmid stabilization system protein ParE
VKGADPFHRLAELELNEAIEYYELERPGLGAAFLNEVERCVRSISEHPEAGPVIRADVRRRLLRRFPYGLLYSVKSDGIRILAVMNLKRRPSYWVGRE